MVALDVLKELNSGFLQLIGTDACGNGVSNDIEVGLQKRVAELAHGEPRNLTMLKQHEIIARDRNRRVQLMRSMPQKRELLPRSRPARRFGEPALADRQRLIGTQNQRTGTAGGN